MKSSFSLLEQFEQGSLFDRFLDEPDFFCKKMFGGLACYYRGLMVACLMEGEYDDVIWQKKRYPFPLWRGFLIPTDFVHQESLLKDLKGVIQHPVLKKWLYLPLESEDYDETSRRLIALLAKGDARLGIIPGQRRTARRRPKKRRSRSRPKSRARHRKST